MARMTEKEKQKDRAKKIKVLTEAAMEWLDKHRMPWQVVDETPAETLHLAGIMAQFAADTLLRHDDNIDDTQTKCDEAQKVAEKLFAAIVESERNNSKFGIDSNICGNLTGRERSLIGEAMVIYARLDRYDREMIRAGKKAVI